MKKLYLSLTILLLLSSILGIYSCKDDPLTPPQPPPPDPVILNDTITLSLSDVTHRSLTINVSTTQNNPESGIKLFRISNSTETLLSEYSIDVKDTSIIDDNNGAGLELNTEYSYYAVRIDSLGERKDTSNTISAKTLAPTSHEYAWEEFIIGEFQSSLYDVWGTDENNVYAVGTIIINDTAYSVIKWDGNSWKPEKKIGGQYAIYGFSEKDIWSVGGGVEHYDGNEWVQIDSKSIGGQGYPLDSVLHHNTTYTSIWGTSSSNLYLGNERGKIIHWDGNKARVLYDFGVYITDIQGTNENNIWITGEKPSQDNALIAHYNGSSFEKLNYYPQYKFPVNTIFPINEKEVYLGGDGVFHKKNSTWITDNVDRWKGVIYKIRGTGSNNIFAAGAFSALHHFNGVDWKFYNELHTPNQAVLQSVFVTGNKVFVVGRSNDFTKAKILIGTKK